jgi:hypothetical protein
VFTFNGVPLPGGPFIGGAEFDHALTNFDLTNNFYEPLPRRGVYE